jgi:arginine/serine-rich splicing factor 1/9
MTRIFVGNLPMDIREREIDDIFYKFGRINDIQIKRPDRPPAFAFVTFSHPRDADDAVHYRDGYDFDGGRIRVEHMKGRGGGRDGREVDITRGSGRSQYRVIVSDLPKSASWQDLKDHFKKSCDVSRVDVDRMGKGCVEFRTQRDMDDGLRLNNSIFVNPFSEAKIKVRAPDDRSMSRSRSGGRGRSRSRSRSRDRHRRSSRSRSEDSRDRRSYDKKSSSPSRRNDDDDEKRKDDRDDENKDNMAQETSVDEKIMN